MKTTEQEYLESYDKKGCLALVFGIITLMLMMSLLLNLVLILKITC